MNKLRYRAWARAMLKSWIDEGKHAEKIINKGSHSDSLVIKSLKKAVVFGEESQILYRKMGF